MSASGEPQTIAPGHIRIHHRTLLGYTRVGGCSEYRVEHPAGEFGTPDTFEFKADVAALYGDQFVEPLSARHAPVLFRRFAD